MRSTSEPLGRDTYRKYPLGPRTIIKEELSHLEKALISPDIRVRIADIKDWLVLQDYISEELEGKKFPYVPNYIVMCLLLLNSKQ